MTVSDGNGKGGTVYGFFFVSVYQSGGVFNCDKKFNNAPKRTVAAYAE
jgi:hypothetical protein